MTWKTVEAPGPYLATEHASQAARREAEGEPPPQLRAIVASGDTIQFVDPELREGIIFGTASDCPAAAYCRRPIAVLDDLRRLQVQERSAGQEAALKVTLIAVGAVVIGLLLGQGGAGFGAGPG